MDGSSGASADSARAFARQLQERLPVPVLLADERLTSAMAERALLEGNVRRGKRKKLRDRVAAVLILQNYLDRKRSER